MYNINSKIATIATSVGVFALFAFVAMPNSLFAQGNNDNKINICHSTASLSNPWNSIEIDESAWPSHLAHGDFLYTGPVGNNGNPTSETWCESHAPSSVTNTCPIPDALGDFTAETILPSGEKTVQEILNDGGYSVDAATGQSQFQIWNVTGSQEITITPEFLDKYAGYSTVFGYYKNGDLSTFTPIFKKGDVAGYSAVDEASVGETYSISTTTAYSIGFAIKASDGVTVTTIATEKSLNPSGVDNVIAYNPASNEYVLAFEDLINGDNDYNDLVVSIKLACSTVQPENPQFCKISSDASTKVIEIKIGDSTPTAVDVPSVLVSSTTMTEQAWTADVDGPSTDAKWIWSEDPVADWETDKIVTFSRTFTVNDALTSATLNVAADNFFTVYLDGTAIGSNSSNSYGSPSAFAIPSLAIGEHTLKFVVENDALEGPALNNPGGLIFQIVLNNAHCSDNGNPGGGNDNTAPTITLLGNSAITLTVGQTFIDPGAVASDVEDLSGGTVTYPGVTAGFTVVGMPPAGTLISTGTYTIVYKYCDSEGACSPEVTRTVNVVAGSTQCSDGVDNDNDSFADANDSGCHTDGNVSNPGSYDPADNNEDTSNGGGGGGETDVCANIEGIQTTVPAGKHADGANCVDDNTGGTTDVCDNIEGIQETVPTGKHISGTSCVDDSNNGGGNGPTDACSNIEGIQETIPSGKHNEGGACVDDGLGGGEGIISTNNNGGGGGRSGSSHRGGGGGGMVLGASTSCGLYLTDYIKYGKDNDKEEVIKLQSLLNEIMGSELKVSGIYDLNTMAVVNEFQLLYKEEILTPWVNVGLHPDKNIPTGYVYRTTQRKINDIVCPSLGLPIPDVSDEVVR